MSKEMKIKTFDRILDVTQDLIQTRGYSSISFSEIALLVGIKKPSVIHHFPSKSALVKAVVVRYRSFFSNALNQISESKDKTALQALEFYFIPYIDVGSLGQKICLCGALAGEFTALPQEIQNEVRLFFRDHQSWLEGILTRGKNSKEFHFDDSPSKLAALFLGALQGALVVQRASGNLNYIQDVIIGLKMKLL
ncbi:MAG: TetR family transcriptional regulator [Candidatus Cloacimonadota bacterium]|nr:MAG: TetR family transcriptional regulator [Candidatus Cloacimonadota bacterium]